MGEVLESPKGQLGFDLGDARVAAPYEPDRDEIRAELVKILEAARAATEQSPWDKRTLMYHKVVFPQMSRWLPSEEREQLCSCFFQEIDRVEALFF